MAAGFLAVAAALIYCLFLLLGGGGNSEDPDGSGGDGGQVVTENKLTAEEEAKRRAQLGDPGSSLVAPVDKPRKKSPRTSKGGGGKTPEAKKKPQPDPAELARKKRAAEIKSLLDNGQAALNSKNFDQAIQAFDKLSKLDPGNPAAKKGLDEARKGKQVLEAKLREAQFAKLVATGQSSLTAKNYDQAVASLRAALKLKPKDDKTAEALKKAEKLQAEARTKKDKLDRKVDRILAKGDKALERHDYATMTRLIKAAETVAPGHAKVVAAKKALEQARKAKANAEEYLKQGRKAFKARKYEEAVRLFTLASQLFPQDMMIKSLLQRANDRLALKKKADAKTNRKKNRKEALTLLAQGRKFLAEQKYQHAVNALTRADKLLPNDPVIQRELKKAQKRWEVVRRQEDADRKKKEEIRKAEEFRRLLAVARTALKEKKLDVATRAIADAGKLKPNDPELKKLQVELEEATRIAAVEARKRADEAARAAARKKILESFQAQMASGKKALKGKKFDEAIKDFTKALLLVEKEKDTLAQQKEAKKAIADARKAKDLDAKLKLKADG
jgi:Flp pilus assembly protein TadD